MNNLALVGINSKYIHPNMAVRILSNDLNNNKIPHSVVEFSIKEDINKAFHNLKDYTYVAFSCYIYNIKYVKELTAMLKEYNPNVTIIYGGPEVSYLRKEDIEKLQADYIVCGEGEKVFVDLLKDLFANTKINNTYVISKQENIIMNKAVNSAPLEYYKDLVNDFTNVNLTNQITYIETSRGCPYQCSYCLASLDNNVRNLDIDQVKNTIKYLLDNKAKLIKLLDRTFNYDTNRTNEIIQFIIDNDNGYTTFQFEITGELFSESSIRLMHQVNRDDLFRFEIGVQSTNVEANKAIRRYQDFDKLAKIIKEIKDTNKVVLHLDLIAGLPNEDLKSFEKTFNDVFNLYPDELQLGFLKLLKGTHLETNIIDEYYKFDNNAPYEIIENKWLSKEDLNKIDIVEHALNNYYNQAKAKKTVLHLLNKYNYEPFFLFSILGEHMFKGINVYNIFRVFFDTQLTKDNNDKIILYNDYYERSKTRPKSLTAIDNKNEVIHRLIEQENLNVKRAFKHACVEKLEGESFYVYMLDTKKSYVIEKESKVN